MDRKGEGVMGREDEQMKRLEEAFISSVNEGWNLMLAMKMLPAADPGARRRRDNQADRFLSRIQKSLNSAGMEYVDFSGQVYTPELPVTVLNMEDVKGEDRLVIQVMKKPVIKYMGRSDIIQMGLAVVEKENKQE